jgi:hypothetical protein
MSSSGRKKPFSKPTLSSLDRVVIPLPPRVMKKSAEEVRAHYDLDWDHQLGPTGGINLRQALSHRCQNGVELFRIQDHPSAEAVSVKPLFGQSNQLTWRIYESPPNNPCSRITLHQTADLRPSQTARKAALARSGPGTVADQEARPIRTGIRESRYNATFGIQLLAKLAPAKARPLSHPPRWPLVRTQSAQAITHLFSWVIEDPCASIFGGLFFYVIDDQHWHWTPLLLQFQPQLFADGIEE